jgi:drug/metabolite transporter (DMT)-like permease
MMRLIKGFSGGSPEARRHIAAALCTVAGIAVTHVAATQAAQQCVLHGVPPLFSMWFSTGWNVLLALPLLRLGTAGTSVSLLVVQTLPFYALWAGANTLYVAALESLTSSLTTALFSVTPALVVLLAVPLLRRRLTLLSVLACLLAAAGVALVAQPWSEASAGESAISLGGLAAVLGAAACAALYKVLFKRCFGEPPTRAVLLVLALLGGWSLSAG